MRGVIVRRGPPLGTLIARCAAAATVAGIAVAAASWAGVAAAADGGCKLVKIADWKLRPGRSLPVTDGAINKREIGVLIDRGMMITSKARSTAIGPFESFAIGDEMIRNPYLRFADIFRYSKFATTAGHLPRAVAHPDMLLGADFLRSHRVLVAHSQRRIYFTYAGGTVFPKPSQAGHGCDDAPRATPDAAPTP